MQLTTEERRQHRRYRLENSVSISSHGVFQIIDISQGGFRFKCPPRTSIPAYWDMDILTSTVTLENLPAKRAWVSMAEDGSHEYVPTVAGARFGRLTKKQSTLLSQLIGGISKDDELVP